MILIPSKTKHNNYEYSHIYYLFFDKSLKSLNIFIPIAYVYIRLKSIILYMFQDTGILDLMVTGDQVKVFSCNVQL